MYCSKCGYKNTNDSKYCRQCGDRLINEGITQTHEEAKPVYQTQVPTENNSSFNKPNISSNRNSFADRMLNVSKDIMGMAGLFESIEEIQKVLGEIESRGNYLEMERVLQINMNAFANDPVFALYVIKCVANGGFEKGKNLQVMKNLQDATKISPSSGGLFSQVMDKWEEKDARKSLDKTKNSISAVMNKYFLNAFKTLLTYGNNDLINSSLKTIEPLFVNLKNYKNFTPNEYDAFGGAMVDLGNIIVDTIDRTNKANFPSCKMIIGLFIDNIITNLVKVTEGIFGLLKKTAISRDVFLNVKALNKRLQGMR